MFPTRLQTTRYGNTPIRGDERMKPKVFVVYNKNNGAARLKDAFAFLADLFETEMRQELKTAGDGQQ